MKLGIIGLGKMGRQIVARLSEDGHEVIATDTSPKALQEVQALGAGTAQSPKELVSKLGPDPVVWLMIPSGAVENEMAALLDIMPRGGIIIDGGNSDYRETARRAKLTAERGVELIDAGTSGGILGEVNGGFSIMVGGNRATVDKLAPVFQCLAQPSGWGYFGPAGAGHYTKMVHNAIEYGMMESLAEGYHLLKENPDYPSLDLAQLAGVWQHGGVISSLLNDLAGQILRANPELSGIDGYVAESGEARWTLERAHQLSIPLPAIQAAMDVRLASQKGKTHYGTKLLAALRNAFGGHSIDKPVL